MTLNIRPNEQHDYGEDCRCKPITIPVERLDGSVGWVYAHNHPNQTSDQLAERAILIFQAIDEVRHQTDEDDE